MQWQLAFYLVIYLPGNLPGVVTPGSECRHPESVTVGLGGQLVHEKVHLVDSSFIQCPFETI